MKARKKTVKKVIDSLYLHRDFRGWWNSLTKEMQKNIIRDSANSLIVLNEN